MKYYSFSGTDAQNAAELFRSYYQKKALYKAIVYDGVEVVCEELKKREKTLGVATYKREDYALRLLKKFGLDKYFDYIHGADNENKMTKTDIVELCIRESGFSKDNAVLVGDTENDAIAAQKCGIEFIGVSYGFGFKKNDYKDFIIIEKARDLLKLL